MKKEPTKMEIIEVLNIFSEKIDKRMDMFEQRIDDLDEKFEKRFDTLDSKIDNLRVEVAQRLDYHEAWLKRIDQSVVWNKDFKA